MTIIPKLYCKCCLVPPTGGDADLVLVIGYGKLCSRCAYLCVGISGLRELPAYQKMKLQPSVLGVSVMRKILEP